MQLCKKQQSARELKTQGRHYLLLLHMQAQDKKGIAESHHAFINSRARLTACEVGIILSDISQLCLHPFLSSSLCSSPMELFLKNYGTASQGIQGLRKKLLA